MKHSNRQEEEKTERKNNKIDKIVWIVMCIVLGIIGFTANTLRMKNDSLKTQVELKTSEITEYEEAFGTPAEKTFIGKLDFELPRIDEITWYCPPNLYLSFLQGKNGKDTVIAKTYRNYSDMTEIHIDRLGREKLKDIIAKQDYKRKSKPTLPKMK